MIPGRGRDVKTSCYQPNLHQSGDTTPSLRVSSEGKYYCDVCRVGGPDLVALAAGIRGISDEEVAEELCHQFVHPVVPASAVLDARSRLASTNAGTDAARFLVETRRITPEVMDEYLLGLDETGRVTIPVMGPYGLVRDLRRWDALRQDMARPKFLPYADGYGASGDFWPSTPTGSDVVLVEGEPDVLVGRSLGWAVYTVMGGAGAFTRADFSWAAGRSVTVVPDTDKAGKDALKTILRELASARVARVRVLAVPEPHKDLGDWVRTEGSAPALAAILSLPWGVPGALPQTRKVIPLVDVSRAAVIGSEITFDGQVAAVHDQAYAIPCKYRVECRGDRGDLCNSCPNELQRLRGTYELAAEDPAFIACVDAKDSQVNKALQISAGLPSTCETIITRLTYTNALRISLIPRASGGSTTTEHVLRGALFIGNHISPGAVARCTGYTCPDPRTQKTVTIITKATGALRAHEDFEMPDSTKKGLDRIWRRRVDPYRMVRWESSILAKHFSRIVHRETLHDWMVLLWHSILELPVAGGREPGWLDILVVGDARTGKGRTVQGCLDAYGCGEVLSGKRCTVPGLIGGTIRHKGGFDVTAGAWTLHDGLLTVIDESTHPSVFRETTRARSEGVAEFTQAGVTQRTTARVRKGWLCNPPPGKSLAGYRYGAEVMRDLVAAEEDVARWDCAIGIISDVPVAEIVQASDPVRTPCPIPRDLWSAKVRWAWSRRMEHVRWSEAARLELSQRAGGLVGDYETSSVGLIQKGNTHAKLRRVAAAVAAATWSTSDGVHLIIGDAHVRAADRFLRDALDGPGLRLGEMVALRRQSGVLGNARVILQPIRLSGTLARPLARRILSQESTSRRGWEALVPPAAGPASEVVDTWIREQALHDDGSKLSVTRAFADLLHGAINGDNSTSTPMM